ncbi:YciI family protein [Niabella ginsengisoli]|uniref:YciI family protein n=1 Tax=Niabella ginsengisoli TaxID=522298 RepID=A0ABS9SIG2_9BACT|nr:YciI family protein [Niabella ginsengisoli]MCH5598153.1 YciI family protein [Niabella ginsengisoli]
MNDFLFIFRRDENDIPKLSPEQMQEDTQKWIDWIGGIAAQNKLNNRGNRLERTGKVVKADNMITDGPYMELKEAIGGYIVVTAESLDEAAELAKGCPIFNYKGNVEVREIKAM